MDDKYFTLNVGICRIGDTYQLELSHTDPSSQAQVAPLRRAVAFDLTALLALATLLPEYGQALGRQLFADPNVKQRFVQVETAAQAAGCFLRIVLCIDPSAQELLNVRWELLRHPDSGAALCTSETLLFSRFMVARDFRAIKLRARSELTALIAIAAPPPDRLQKMSLAPVDSVGEESRVRAALHGLILRTLAPPFTVDRLLDELHTGVDILYLVSHGMFGRSTGTPALVLQDDTGDAKVVKGDDLTGRIGELQRVPRLVVLASCQSAGDGEPVDASQRATVQATLAGRLADAGVPAVLAMQGCISMATVEKMMPVFFTELLRDGQIDRALAVARGTVRERADAWMPVLYTRLSSGRLWYTPGFTGEKGKEVWRRLVKPVRDGKVVPILGPRLLDAAYGAETAVRLAKTSHFPFAAYEWDDMPRVTQFIGTKESRYNVLAAYQDQLLADLIEQNRSWLPSAELPPINKSPKLGKLLSLVGDHLREVNPFDPYRILAELPAAVFLTTNFDPLLERALRANQREPQPIVTRWRYQKSPQSADPSPIAIPTVKTPVVYHAFGAFGLNSDESLVLTEDNYFDYLIETASAKLMPHEVESALVDNSLLFLGFRLTDWHFRVLFRLMMSLPGRERLKQYCHVAVQLDPSMQTMADVEGAKIYLAEYFGKEANIDIYWGSAEEFLKSLHDELAEEGEPTSVAAPKKDDDEWNF